MVEDKNKTNPKENDFSENSNSINNEIKKTDWIKIKPAELERIIIEIYKQGETPAKIGMILRDKYGIPKAKLLGKRIEKILKDAKMPIKSQKEAIQEKIEHLSQHIEKNKHDQSARKKLAKELWAVKRASN